MSKPNEKEPRFNEYHDASYEDVRTIPDFYDNLYPTADKEENGFPAPSKSYTKKREKQRNSENSGENTK